MTRGTTACLLFSACLASFLGCGGRTETLFDDAGAGGLISSGGDGLGGSPAVSGAPSVGGSGVAGGAIHFAGSPGVGGSPSFAGGPSAGGSANIAGAPPSKGGSPGFGGFTGIAGMPNFGGMPSFGGFGGDAGAAGFGGLGGVIVDTCVSVAPSACEKCECQVCADQVIGCFTDVGCASIFSCIQNTGCQGFGCYTNATCRKVINQFGGLTGSSASEVFALGSCALSSQNVCACN